MSSIEKIVREELEAAEERIRTRLHGFLAAQLLGESPGGIVELVRQRNEVAQLSAPQSSGNLAQQEPKTPYECAQKIWLFLRDHPGSDSQDIRKEMGWRPSSSQTSFVKRVMLALKPHVRRKGRANKSIYFVRDKSKPIPDWDKRAPRKAQPRKAQSKREQELKKVVSFLKKHPGSPNRLIGRHVYGDEADSRYTYHLIKKLLDQKRIRYEEDPKTKNTRLYFAVSAGS